MSKRSVWLRFLGFGFAMWGCASENVPDSENALAGLRDCSDPSALHAASIAGFVDSLPHSWSYVPLTLDAMNSVTAATRALDAGDLEHAWGAAGAAGYTLTPLLTDGGCYWWLAPTETAAAGQASMIYAVRSRRALVIEAPHVPEDNGTGTEAALLFSRLGAKAVIIAGAHRCAITDPSGCRSSMQCNRSGVAVESDPAHSVHNALNAMHLAFRGADALVLQLHTNFKPDVNGDAMVSNGTRYPIAGTAAEAFYRALSGSNPDADVRSCNDPDRPPASAAFCGETSTQSLSSNGAADPCLGRPASGGGPELHPFIHLEQAHTRMEAIEAWSDRIAAALELAIHAQ